MGELFYPVTQKYFALFLFQYLDKPDAFDI